MIGASSLNGFYSWLYDSGMFSWSILVGGDTELHQSCIKTIFEMIG